MAKPVKRKAPSGWQVFKMAFTDWRKNFIRQMNETGGFFKYFIKWFVPGFVNGCCIFLCMLQLHVATLYYIKEMTEWEKNYQVRPNATFKGWEFSNGKNITDTSFGSLNDPLEKWMGYQNIDISTLDKVAAFFPACFAFVCVLNLDLRTYTLVMICNAFLALIKGALGAMTTVPDSIGWQKCKERIGEDGVNWFIHAEVSELLGLEIFGLHGKHLRWCGDMLYSGHTYFTCLYALGLYQLIRKWFATADRDSAGRWVPVMFITILGIGEQALEVYAVLSSHFHYSMDVFMAILITLLFFTSGPINIIAKRWTLVSANQKKNTYLVDQSGHINEFRSGGDILIPFCCFPFCHLAGREHLFTDEEIEHVIDYCLDDLENNIEFKSLMSQFKGGKDPVEVFRGLDDKQVVRLVKYCLSPELKKNTLRQVLKCDEGSRYEDVMRSLRGKNGAHARESQLTEALLSRPDCESMA